MMKDELLDLTRKAKAGRLKEDEAKAKKWLDGGLGKYLRSQASKGTTGCTIPIPEGMNIQAVRNVLGAEGIRTGIVDADDIHWLNKVNFTSIGQIRAEWSF